MSVGIKSNNGSRGSLDAIYISKGRLGRGNTDWIDRCKGTFTLLTRVEEKNSRRVQSTKGRGYFGMRPLVRGWIVY